MNHTTTAKTLDDRQQEENPTMSKSLSPLTDKVYTRAPYWADVPDEKWMDWR